MRPYDEIPFEESDYSDVALLVASVRDWPTDDFARELDARVAQRFAAEAAPHASRIGRGRLSPWMAGPAAALAAGVAAVVVLSGGGSGALMAGRSSNGSGLAHHAGVNNRRQPAAATQEKPVVNLGLPATTPTTTSVTGGPAESGAASTTSYSPRHSATLGTKAQPDAANAQATNAPATFSAADSLAPVAPGSKQIQAAEISLTTPNEHVDQVAQEVFAVVGAVHGSVLSSHITSATSNSGGGYASFALSIPTSNLQDAMTQLSRLHYAAVSSRTDASQNVSGQYNNIQRQLADATALRASLLKQLQAAYTQQAIDSIKAQLRLAEQEINSWQKALNSLNHRITYSNVTVQINAGGLPVVPVAHHNNSFTIGRAAHDALHVLVVSAGVALIALAVAIPVGLVAALLMWLWVWLRQRRREHALDATA